KTSWSRTPASAAQPHSGSGSAMSTQRSSASDLGTGLITALAQRDFPQLANTLTPDVRMRALIPPGPIEVLGPEAVAAKFSSWFADTGGFGVICSGDVGG